MERRLTQEESPPREASPQANAQKPYNKMGWVTMRWQEKEGGTMKGILTKTLGVMFLKPWSNGEEAWPKSWSVGERKVCGNFEKGG